jgi:hypothetical protein
MCASISEILLKLEEHIGALGVHVLIIVLGHIDLFQNLFLIIKKILQLLVLNAGDMRRND